MITTTHFSSQGASHGASHVASYEYSCASSSKASHEASHEASHHATYEDFKYMIFVITSLRTPFEKSREKPCEIFENTREKLNEKRFS